jgi:hypothetical protein
MQNAKRKTSHGEVTEVQKVNIVNPLLGEPVPFLREARGGFSECKRTTSLHPSEF